MIHRSGASCALVAFVLSACALATENTARTESRLANEDGHLQFFGFYNDDGTETTGRSNFVMPYISDPNTTSWYDKAVRDGRKIIVPAGYLFVTCDGAAGCGLPT